MDKKEIMAMKKAKHYRKKPSLLKHCWQFESVETLKKYIITKKKCPDYVAIYDIPFTMEEYDMSGKQIFYANKRLYLQIEVNHNNRYKDMADINFIEMYETNFLRNDINYLE